jgi:hypothetical protein
VWLSRDKTSILGDFWPIHRCHHLHEINKIKRTEYTWVPTTFG